MLKNNARINESEIIGGKLFQAVRYIQRKVTMTKVLMEVSRQLNHGGRNVHAPALVKMLG